MRCFIHSSYERQQLKNVIMKYLFALTLLLAACSGKNTIADSDGERTQATVNLLENLVRLTDSTVCLVGHQDDTCFGVGWRGDSARSDVKSVCGDLPAVVGFELGGVERGSAENIDGVAFHRIRQQAIAHFDRGGMVIMAWHPNSPLSGAPALVPDSLLAGEKNTVAACLDGGKCHQQFVDAVDSVASFLNTLVTPYGVKVPVLLTLWPLPHAANHWWSQPCCAPSDYQALWRLTADRLRQQGANNVLLVYAHGMADNTFQPYYPGNDVADVLALDATGTDVDQRLSRLCALAHEQGKPAAVVGAGQPGIPDAHYWTTVLAPLVQQHPVAFVLIGSNAYAQPGRFCAPFPGHPSASDFVAFYNLPHTVFLSDLNALYLSPEQP